ncbi:MAG TPA: sialidase family protein [Gaiellaceae bacterium]|nr:sialidase family protein [Gaiellaceae bacterium]
MNRVRPAVLAALVLATPAAAATIVGKPGATVVRGTAKADRIDAADGKRQQVLCGKGRDFALVDELDRTSGCETVARRVAVDTTSGAGGQHRTLLEPQLAASGSTVVGVFQSGRHQLAGADAIGFAVSHDAGRTWKAGVLPGFDGWDSKSNASVAWDAAHGRWLAEAAVLDDTAGGVLVSSSADGLSWAPPVTAVRLTRSGPTDAAFDKPWIACDDTPSSPRYGRCYLLVSLDVTLPSARIAVWTSDDGGATWTQTTARLPAGNGSQPAVLPDGTLVVVYTDLAEEAWVEAVRSTDGGATFSPPVRVSPEQIGEHVADGLRAPLFPSLARTPGGGLALVWPDCGASASCSRSQLLLSRSADGAAWSAPQPLPLGAAGDDLSPGLAVDPQSGRLAVAYVVSWGSRCCQLDVRLAVQQANGRWSVTQADVRSLAKGWTATSPGAFLGDYLAAAWSDGHAVALLPVARPPRGGRLSQDLYAVRS